jgi:hypothetical protein
MSHEGVHARELILLLMRQQTLDRDGAVRQAREVYGSEAAEEADAFLKDLEERILTGGPPTVVIGDFWYFGPDQPPENERWWGFWNSLSGDESFDSVALDALDRASTRILGSNPAPWTTPSGSRGLVLGHVQSGKTTNFTALIAKAADAGYRLVIVLAGLTNSLRQQTQVRLDMQLELDSGLWQKLTSADDEAGGRSGDFSRTPNPAAAVMKNEDAPLVAVIKKNGPRMKRLHDWLAKAPEEIFETHATLVIDDEADQASINTGTGANRSAINRHIEKLLSLTNGAYVGYTATPFANVLANPDDEASLYPRNFIIELGRPRGYMGPEELFGRDAITGVVDDTPDDGYDMIRHVPVEDAEILRPPSRPREDREAWEAPDPDATPSLKKAVEYFVLATAARRARGQHGHSSMLIHTTMFVDPQEAMRRPVEKAISNFVSSIDDEAFLEHLRTLWVEEHRRVPSEEKKLDPVPFEELQIHLPKVLFDVGVVVDNGRSEAEDRLRYPDDDPQTVIAIGGNTLSRGLTLEGLVVSYFLRSSTTYDTLLQMGRWFGYRPGYSDLPRVWMPKQLEDDFRVLSTVEEQIRLDIRRYGRLNKKPSELATRIRHHPGMLPTSRAKLRHAGLVKIGYGGWSGQTYIFNNNEDELKSNLRAARMLVQGAAASDVEPEECPGRSGYRLLRDVPASVIQSFFDSYSVNERHEELAAAPFRKFIDKEGSGRIPTWNVVFASRATPLGVDKHVDLGNGVKVNLIRRTNKQPVGSDLDIGHLGDSQDRAPGGTYNADGVSMRGHGDPALLLLYIVDKDSEPDEAYVHSRANLKAEAHVLGFVVEFPEFGDENESYWQVRLGAPSVEDQEMIQAVAEESDDLLAEIEERDSRSLAKELTGAG